MPSGETLADMTRLPIDRIALHWGQMPVNVRFSYGQPRDFPFLLVHIQTPNAEGWGEGLVNRDARVGGLANSLVGKDASRLDELLNGPWLELRDSLREPFSMALH